MIPSLVSSHNSNQCVEVICSDTEWHFGGEDVCREAMHCVSINVNFIAYLQTYVRAIMYICK